MYLYYIVAPPINSWTGMYYFIPTPRIRSNKTNKKPFESSSGRVYRTHRCRCTAFVGRVKFIDDITCDVVMTVVTNSIAVSWTQKNLHAECEISGFLLPVFRADETPAERRRCLTPNGHEHVYCIYIYIYIYVQRRYICSAFPGFDL